MKYSVKNDPLSSFPFEYHETFCDCTMCKERNHGDLIKEKLSFAGIVLHEEDLKRLLKNYHVHQWYYQDDPEIIEVWDFPRNLQFGLSEEQATRDFHGFDFQHSEPFQLKDGTRIYFGYEYGD